MGGRSKVEASFNHPSYFFALDLNEEWIGYNGSCSFICFGFNDMSILNRGVFPIEGV